MKKICFSILLFLLIILYNRPVFYTVSDYFDEGNNYANNFSTRCWDAPFSPGLISPSDNFSTNSTDVGFFWSATSSSCPIATIEYNFQIYSDSGLTTLVTESGFSTNLFYSFVGIPEGEYWWRVQTQDQYGNTSNSGTNHLIVDRISPLASLSVTGSWTKIVNEKINNGDFETGDLTGWAIAGNVQTLTTDTFTNPDTTVNPQEGSYMVRIGNPDDPGNFVWENLLMQSFDKGAKALSLHYNFFSRDYDPYDVPGFLIRINGQEIFKLNNLGSDGTNALSTDWTEFYYDLSNHNDDKVNLALYAGNTGDTLTQSWVYLDKITTYFVSAPSHAVYNLMAGDPIPAGGAASGIDYCEYNVDSSGWLQGFSFSIVAGGTHAVEYRCVDNAGNSTPLYLVTVITDDKKPSAITDLSVDSTAANSVSLSWNPPYNDFDDPLSGKAASYDVRYSTSPINDGNFSSAAKVEKVPSPKEHNTLDPLDINFDSYQEHLEILGLNPATTYYFALKSSDEAPNTSDLSNVLSGTTVAGTTVNAGDVIINELMWMGSSVSDADEWLELRNMTDHSIDLSNFKLTKLSGSETDMAISFTGKSIPAHGYFLIANDNSYAGGDSQLKDTITPDIWDSSLDLSDSTLQIKLYWNESSTDYLIDTAWDGTAPAEGFYDTTFSSEKYYSMERISVPGDGINPLSWYTCIDEASKSDFFDNTADERGTPSEENRSENEPLAHQSLLERPSETPTPEQTTPTQETSPTPEFTFTPTPTELVPTPSPTFQVGDTVTPTQTPVSENYPTLEVTDSPVEALPTP